MQFLLQLFLLLHAAQVKTLRLIFSIFCKEIAPQLPGTSREKKKKKLSGTTIYGNA